jgi:class 3 adenylate cyclase
LRNAQNYQSRGTKLEKIAEILGLLEEKGKNKDWLLDEIKRYKVALKVSPTTNSFEILRSCPQSFIKTILVLLKNDEFEIEEVNTLSKTMHWFFTDIVGSSNPKLSTKTQVRKILMLIKLIQKTNTFNEIKDNNIFQHTGDGVAIGFSESPEHPLRLAIELLKLVNKYNKTKSEKEKIYIRIGIDTGPVYFIKDLDGNEAIWGPGIITTKRVMDLCDSNQIFTSRRLGDDVSNLSPEYKAIMHSIGEYEIKHGEKLSIYNIYGKGFGNKRIPIQNRITEENKPEIKIPKYQFNKVDLKLDVTDPKTMMTHHTWIWDVKNISKTPLTLIHYPIGGDIPKKIEELNISISDQFGEKIENYVIKVDKSQQKQIDVELPMPLKKNKSTIISLQYDWEEPDRSFIYDFSALCKKMSYELTLPKGIPVTEKVLEINVHTGEKIIAFPLPTRKEMKDKTRIVWVSDKKHTMERSDAFEFRW